MDKLADKLSGLKIAAAAAALRSGAYSPVELVQSYLNRIDIYEPNLHTFRTIMREQALEHARQAEKELSAGLDRGPLHGIPVTVKDNIAAAGMAMTNGSGRAPAFCPARDAAIVRRLRHAGAIVIGKSHLHEFAYGPHHPGFAAVLNPWNAMHAPGGSSSGAAAGIAASFALGAIGTDSAGSIRVPASFCGAAGFKPTRGLIDMEGVTPLSPTLDHIGFAAGSAEDAALLLQALACGTGHGGATLGSATSGTNDDGLLRLASLEGIRIGVPDIYLQEPTEPETAAAASNAIACMQAIGAKIVRITQDLPIRKIKETTWTILQVEAYQLFREEMNDWMEGSSLVFRANLERGKQVEAEAYCRAMEWRRETGAVLDEIFSNVDVLIAPTCPWPAPRIAARQKSRVSAANGEYAALASLWGLPALSLTAGLSAGKLPIGLQITGRFGADELVLAIGRAYEQISGWSRLRPVL